MRLHADRISPALGADVVGLTPETTIDNDIADELHALLMEHQVLFMHDLDLSPTTMSELGAALGTLGARHHSYVTHEESDDVVILEWKDDDTPDAAEWHADMTYRTSPPFASILKGVVIPPAGGDTLWASMYSVYDALPKGMQDDLSTLHAVHDMGSFRTPAYRSGGDEGILEAYNKARTATHPMVEHHPVTGRPYLNVSESFTRFVIGLSAPDGGRLLTELFDRINRPEHHIRLRWKPNTLALWDNRGTQHYAVADYLPHRRVMHRVAVVDDARSPSTEQTVLCNA